MRFQIYSQKSVRRLIDEDIFTNRVVSSRDIRNIHGVGYVCLTRLWGNVERSYNGKLFGI
jgi:hypothetical protein